MNRYCTFILQGRRQAKDYRKILNFILNIRIQSNITSLDLHQPKFTEFVCDFERAVWKVVGEIFPCVTIKGCAFHLIQVFFRNIPKIGLASAYIKNFHVRIACRCFMAIQLLPFFKFPNRFYPIKDISSFTYVLWIYWAKLDKWKCVAPFSLEYFYAAPSY